MANLRLITSCSQKKLLAAFADSMCASPLPPLEKECIITLSHGMSRWISIELAARLGVTAGFDFNFPNELLDKCFSSILHESSSSLPYTHTSLTWRIASQLPELSQKAGFEQVLAYLGDGRDDRRLLQISRTLADCFDQYTIFRPETICRWDNGKDDNWQAQLWRSISKDSPGRHRAAMLQTLQDHVVRGGSPRSTLPLRINLFGISYLPPFHLEALRLFSHYCDVNVYLLNPCGQYWGTIISEKMKSRLDLNTVIPVDAKEYYETGNQLLSSLGTLGQEFFETLLEYGFESEELEFVRQKNSNSDDSTTPSLLSVIQNDIYTLVDRSRDTKKMGISAADQTVQIHSCHGVLREMEIVYDNLLGLFDQQPDLEPRHVVVMIPDIETYAPYISSVFGNRSSGRQTLPFTIADRSIRRENCYIDAFLKLVSTASSRFTLQETLDILETPSVMQRFDISEDEYSDIASWLKDCNVFWGFDAAHRADLGFPHYDDYSWQAGLDKLFLGYAMSSTADVTFNGILPYSACSGIRAAALGKLAEFITTIRKYYQLLALPHSLPEWADILTSLVTHLLLPNETDAAGPLNIAKAINSLREASSLHGFHQQISIAAVQEHLTEMLAKSGSGYGFMGGGITFCAMLPMRSIPMRVIWLAGMNDGLFPRTEKPPGFSIMNGSRRRGDRSVRDEDRYQFLEALMAAEDYFCISYNGQSDRDNAILPPSVLVAELLDYISSGFVLPDGVSPISVVTKHHLQGFSPRYFDNSDPKHLFSYDRENCRAIETARLSGISRNDFIDHPLPFDKTTPLLLDLHQFKRFLANPAAAFLEKRLGVSPFNPSEEPEDSEPFSLDSLASYTMSQKLVSKMLQGIDYDKCLAMERSCGTLPPLSAGIFTFDTIWEKSRLFTAALTPLREPQLEALTVDFVHPTVHLRALLENCQAQTHLRWRCAGLKGKDRLSLWIEHLLLNIARTDGYPIESKMVASDTILHLQPVDNAAEILNDLLDIYCQGMTYPLPFFPETSWAFFKDGQSKAERAWRGDQRLGFRGECDNQSVALCFRSKEPWGNEFNLLAQRIYGPLSAATK